MEAKEKLMINLLLFNNLLSFTFSFNCSFFSWPMPSPFSASIILIIKIKK